MEDPSASQAETQAQEQAKDDVQEAFSGDAEQPDSRSTGDGTAPTGPDGQPVIDDRPVSYDGDLKIDFRGPQDFDPDELRSAFRTMLLSRRLDEKMMTLLKQGQGFFHIGCAGHEGAQAALGMHARPGPVTEPDTDRFCFYYRDLCIALSLGMTPRQGLLAHLAKKDDPNSGGRQMPEHFGLTDLGVMTTSSSVGAQFLPALGFAMKMQRDGSDGFVYASCGDGATSQGDFHEALNWAARISAPVLFFVQDNKYAISVPVEDQTAGGTAHKLARGYEGLARMRVDGTDFFHMHAAGKAAIEHIRSGEGPVCLTADLVRLFPHSSSDNHTKYRTEDELKEDRQIDPIGRMQRELENAGVFGDHDAEAMREEVRDQVDEAAEWAKQQEDPAAETATDHVYFEGDLDLDYDAGAVEETESDPMVMIDGINQAHKEEMRRDERVVVYGEDVAGSKGGVFTATRDLTAEFGEERCYNSPLAEASIIGTAVGQAAAGLRPVIEIQFADYIWPGMQQIRNQVAPFRYRSNDQWSCPMVIRVPCGGYIHGGLCHSQNVESIFGHTPGLVVVMPSTAADAKGMLKTAIRSEDPVMFLEHKALYRAASARTGRPTDDYLVPLGEARTHREGTDLSIITYGMMVHKAHEAAEALSKQDGAEVEIIDLRSITPLDTEAVLDSIKKTNRALVLYEDHEHIGFGAELSAQIGDKAFEHLDAPIRRHAGAFTPIPFADPLESAVLPQTDGILEAAREVLAY
ncbi:MAG: tungsten formylmethanofuran dehydrogenase [Bacteroidetes bacterium QS_9_68_14]|nr:MAG: tungsten formylmethanofuran dehydrogenase [Bacteroidetes bacterium QS_9_68_14]